MVNIKNVLVFAYVLIALTISTPALAQSVSGVTGFDGDQGFFYQELFSNSKPELTLVTADYDRKGKLSFHWVATNITLNPFTHKTVVVERLKTRLGKAPTIPEVSSYGGNWLVSGNSVARLPYTDLILPSGKGKNRYDGTYRAMIVLGDCPLDARACDDTNRQSIEKSNTLDFVIKNNVLTSFSTKKK
ncbi:hypothetical protein K2Q16_02730 [Patescibacteria group bacterium]|nr:hypothetical protein [Patescibacteria group bacterium]